jgi:hypothetical protein
MRRIIEQDSEVGKLLGVGFSESLAIKRNDSSPSGILESRARMGKIKK